MLRNYEMATKIRKQHSGFLSLFESVRTFVYFRNFVAIVILFSIFYFPFSSVQAFESSSANFELHASDIQSITGSSSSATFRSQGAGGQSAGGISSLTNKVYAGILYWLHGFFTAQYTQAHFRWRADDNTETLASFPVNIDTQYVNFPKNIVKRLRFEVSNEGWTRGSPPVFRIEVAQTATCSDGTYAPVLTDYSGHWHIATSTQFLDEDPTTNVSGCSPQSDCITDENVNFVAGRIKDTSNTTSAITLTSQDFTEVEFGVMALSAATDNPKYCFRLTDNGSIANMVYSEAKYATAIVASGLPITGSLDSAVFDTFNGGGALQGPAYNSIMWKGTEGTGKVRFQFATSDCSNGKTDPPTCSSGGWTFYGSGDSGVTCNASSWYDTNTSGFGGGPDKPVELACSPAQHNNQRYFRYRIQVCSNSDANCSTSGTVSPVVEDVIVNWSP